MTRNRSASRSRALPLSAAGGPRAARRAFKPAVVYDLGGKFDKSFNEGVFNGAEKIQEGDRRRVPRFRAPERRPARAGAAPLRPRRLLADRRRRLQPGDGARRRSPNEFPNLKFAIIDIGRRQAERRSSIVFKEHEGSYLVGLLAAAGLEDRQGRLRRRHGHPADPQVRLRLRPGRQVRQEGRRGVPEHDRHDRRRLERSGQGRRARQEPDRPRRRRRSTTPPAAPASACCARRRMPASSASASIRTRTACIRARC